MVVAVGAQALHHYNRKTRPYLAAAVAAAEAASSLKRNKPANLFEVLQVSV